jgi:hypothetical protein
MAARPPHISITVVVNGTPVVLETAPTAALQSLFEKALKEAKVPPPHQPDKWLFKDANGIVYDKHKTLVELGIGAGATIFLSLEAGAAG